MSDPTPTPPFKPRHVRCPACAGTSLYSPNNPYRPFCSARCKGVDLGAWASEEFKLPDDTPPDENFADPRLQ
jgi:endogenous inhibitor of DNA gyrase (YacG/DUF329 family)